MTTKRSGFSLMETTVAIALLAAAGAICVQVLVAGAAARRAADQRLFASREAANVMERLMAAPRDRLTPESVETLTLRDEAIDVLPGAKLTVALAPSTDEGPPATRVTLTLAWKTRAGTAALPVRLVAWHYGAAEDQP
ncbi:MAG TPA: hypothetical protein DD670_09295 [Planctomycetaceae bacterium]|nr:hypothetical protein [Planctomycetaceae bacterium]